MRTRTALSLLSLLIMQTTTAQIDRSKAPAPGPAPVVNVGGHQTYNMPNGMRVIVVENHKLPMVSMQVKFDTPPVSYGDKAGLPDLVGDLLGSGTVLMPKEAIDRKVDGLGASLATTPDGLYASCLTKNFNELFQLCFEVATSATFPQEEFNKAKTRMLSGLKSRVDDPDQISEAVGRVLTFGKGHPYGEIATEASVGRIQQEHLVAYHKRWFIPSKGYIVLVGDITEAQARKLTDGTFAPWVETPPAGVAGVDGVEADPVLGTLRVLNKTSMPAGPRRVAIVDKPGAAQSVVRVVWPLDLRPGYKDALSAQVMNTILGGGVFNARLMQNLREKHAFTYGAYSETASDRWNGHFSAGASVRTEVTDSAVAELLVELEQMRLDPVRADEIELARSFMAGSFARSLEDPRTIARFALNTYLDKLPHDHYQTWLARLDTVSATSVLDAARSYLQPDHSVVLVVGDKDKVMAGLKRFATNGNVEIYNSDGELERNMPKAAPAGMTAQLVIDAYVKACGGEKALAGLKDVRITSTSTLQGMPISLVQWYGRPDRYASEMKSGTMVLERTVHNGGRARITSPMGSKELADQQLNDVSQNAMPFPELKYAEWKHDVKLGGIVDVNGRACYRLLVVPQNATTFTEFYDTETGFKLRRVETRVSEEGSTTVTTDYGDYRPVNGVFFPYSVKQNVGIEIALTVTEVLVNKGVDAKVFELD